MSQKAPDVNDNRPVAILPNFENIPESLKSLDRWVVWRYELSEKGKWTKRNYQPGSWRYASVKDHLTWSTFEQAHTAYLEKEYDGVGFVLSEADGIVGMDLDDCLDQDGRLTEQASRIIEQADTYSEWSPSGEGVRLFARGSLPPSGRKKGKVEMYAGGKFLSVTGAQVDDTPDELQERDSAIRKIHAEIFGEPETPKNQPTFNYAQPTLSDDEIVAIIRKSASAGKFSSLYDNKPTGDHSNADLELCNMLSFYTKDAGQIDRIFRSSALFRDKWDEKRPGGTYGQMTIAKALARQTGTYSADYRSNGSTRTNTTPTNTNGNGRLPTQKKVGATLQKPADILKYRAEDGGVLDCWREMYAHDWRYITGQESWLRWNGRFWRKDEEQKLQKQIQDLLDTMNRLAKQGMAEIEKEGTAELSKELKARLDAFKAIKNATKRSKQRISSIEGMAQAHCAVRAADLNAGNVLNLNNGTLDLDTYQLRDHNPDDLQTYVLPYSYDEHAKCPRWLQFMAEVLIRLDEFGNPAKSIVVGEDYVPDGQLTSLIQEYMGYCLTTDTKHELMAWLAGEGGNGKSRIVIVLQNLLGPLALSINFQALGMPGNYDLASIPGKRVIFSTESERGGKLAEGMIRQIVSGEQLTARPIYGTPFEFAPVAKIVWGMNNMPHIRDTSNATWRRLALIPFHRTFTDQDKDPDLTPKLLAELPGILNWCLAGLTRLRKEGKFTVSETVKKAVESEKTQHNPVAQFVEECTARVESEEFERGLSTSAKQLYEAYCQWCKQNGRETPNSTNFGREIKRRGIPHKRKESSIQYALVVL